MSDFPLEYKQDISKYGFDKEDIGMRSEMDGGYVLTRRRHTRAPRRMWKTGFTDLSNEDKLTFDEFWDSHGTYSAFNYTVPFGGEIVNVRFKSKPTWDFAGWPSNPRWNISDIVLEEV